MKSAFNFIAAGLAAVFLGGAANAASVSCPDGGDPLAVRVFTADPAVGSCYAFGTNSPGVGANDKVLAVGTIPGLKLLDQVIFNSIAQDASAFESADGALSITVITTNPSDGAWTIDTSLFSSIYKKFVLVIKSATGFQDPDWAAFQLPIGATDGTYSISKSVLIEARLYAAPIPLPAAGLLLLGALGGLGVIAARRRTV